MSQCSGCGRKRCTCNSGRDQGANISSPHFLLIKCYLDFLFGFKTFLTFFEIAGTFLNQNPTSNHALPSAPYVRGYLKKITLALDLNPETTWQTYVEAHDPRQSGHKDHLPQNRFAIQSINKKNVALAFLGGLIIIYIIFSIGRLLNKPAISLLEPAGETTTLTTPSFYIKGNIQNYKDILTINGAAIYINEAGEFNKEFSLTPGANSFEIVVKRFLGRETRLTRHIIYEPINPDQPQR